ncbi:hypothetical protein FGU65_00610 [Methanoculleus sp. FWC-SCC1]|uniref:PH domain-containing protein n=1 Tax=Methanoculleus frigidifontis TaxID=2584085 RepID=A0ABT8M641_9EURY|nr:DUF6141 family protein [Methanoculleus sp. FWC-SCC1]MDN7023414.1 hypothetical protein [Methanoculleus sp. FWC-SCC1]
MPQDTDNNEIRFREVQRFRQPLLWLFLIALAAFSLFSIVYQVVLGIPVGNNPAPDSVLFLIWVIFGVGFPLFFALLSLTVEVRGSGLYYRFLPLHLSFRRIECDEVATIEAKEYRPLLEFGGWGIRYGGRGRKAYNVSGTRGVEILLKSGKRVLFGSQRPEELARAIGEARSRSSGGRA